MERDTVVRLSLLNVDPPVGEGYSLAPVHDCSCDSPASLTGQPDQPPPFVGAEGIASSAGDEAPEIADPQHIRLDEENGPPTDDAVLRSSLHRGGGSPHSLRDVDRDDGAATPLVKILRESRSGSVRSSVDGGNPGSGNAAAASRMLSIAAAAAAAAAEVPITEERAAITLGDVLPAPRPNCAPDGSDEHAIPSGPHRLLNPRHLLYFGGEEEGKASTG